MLTKLDLLQIKKIVQKEVHQEINPIKKDIKTLKSDIKKIQKTTDAMLDVLDREDVALRRRVEKIEDHLALASS